MGWVKLDDNFPMHPKVVGLSLEARWAYVESLCYAARFQTDGMVPDVVAANGSVRAELLDAGLWESGTAAVRIHDFLDWNLSRRASNALSKARGKAGSKGAANRWQEDGKRHGNSHGKGSGLVGSGLGSGFDQFWNVYPRKVGKPRAREAFARCARSTPTEDIVAGAERYANDPNREDEFTAHPTTWLNREGWNDAALPSRKPKTPGLKSHKRAEALRRQGL